MFIRRIAGRRGLAPSSALEGAKPRLPAMRRMNI